MSSGPEVNQLAPDARRNEPYPAASQETRTIAAQSIFSIIAVGKCVREPAWGGSVDWNTLVNDRVRTGHRSILLSDV
jgi:hypothetical protein